MRDHDIDQDPPSADLLAAEFVLGVLDTEGRRDVRRRMAREPAFARLVEDWERRLAPLVEELDSADVPAHLWPRIRTRLGWVPVQTAGAADPSRVAFWRRAAGAGFAAAAALAVVAFMRPAVVPPAPPTVVQAPPAPVRMPELPVTRLVQENGGVAFLATVDPRNGGLWLVPVPEQVTPGSGQQPVLWLIPAGQSPRAVSYVAASRSDWVELPASIVSQVQAGAVLAVTMEPVSPTLPAAPSQAPMATGSLSL